MILVKDNNDLNQLFKNDNKYFFKLNLNKFTLGLDWILEGTVFQTLAP